MAGARSICRAKSGGRKVYVGRVLCRNVCSLMVLCWKVYLSRILGSKGRGAYCTSLKEAMAEGQPRGGKPSQTV